MKLLTVSAASFLLVAGALSTGVAPAVAAEGSETTLTAQTKQMDSLASTRGEAAVSSRISSEFTQFAGSSANADSLVAGLRNGTSVTLTSTDANGATASTTFTPPTGKMGYGSVFISLSLAKQQLAGLGITEPTAQQLQAALVGGTVTTSSGQTVKLSGVLQLRSQGMGWGQIANTLGFKLGPVISGMKAVNAQVAAQASVRAGGSTAAGADVGAPGRSGGGIVTGAGGRAGTPAAGDANTGRGHAYGQGIVTGAGSAASPAGASAARGGGQGKGR